MENREITIVSSKTQRKSVIMSGAETLGELKADLRANNIDYTDMAFFEGTARVELKDDNSMLPKDVPYKGTITNKLVFMLSQTNKKIRSGAMSRTEIYEEIKKNDLQEKCKKVFGRNFTMCKTADLLYLLEKNKSDTNDNSVKEESVTKEESSVKEEQVTKEEPSSPVEFVDIKARDAIKNLIHVLYDNDYISHNEYSSIISNLNDDSDDEANNNSGYSDKEINDMFDFL